jgi:hypothetical protein
MTPDFQREEALFSAASELESAAARAAYLARECAGDDRLRERIEEMLESDAPAAEYFRAPQPEFQGQAPEPEPNLPGPNSTVVGYGSEAIGCYRLLEKLGEGGRFTWPNRPNRSGGGWPSRSSKQAWTPGR